MACWAAPSEGVLVVAPEKRPAQAKGGMPSAHPSKAVRGRAREDDRRRAEIQRKPLIPERREESRPDLQSYGEDEENQAEFLHELENSVVDMPSEMAEEDSGEEDSGDAEPHALDLDRGEGKSGDRDDGKDEDGEGHLVSSRQMLEQVHGRWTVS